MKDYYWDEETVDYFKFASEYTNREGIFQIVKVFVEVNCQLEEGDDEVEMVENLINKVYNEIN
jgi:C4-type Zn-finger protein